jgi:hypothetical protein
MIVPVLTQYGKREYRIAYKNKRKAEECHLALCFICIVIRRYYWLMESVEFQRHFTVNNSTEF